MRASFFTAAALYALAVCLLSSNNLYAAGCGPEAQAGGSNALLTAPGITGSNQVLYDSTKVEIVSGTVEGTEKVEPAKGMLSTVQLILRTKTETVAVQLCPEWYIGRSEMKIITGDVVEVKGSRGMSGGRPVLIAAEIKKAKSTLVLRSDIGVPVWPR